MNRIRKISTALIVFGLFFVASEVSAQVTLNPISFSTPGDYDWRVPAGVSSINVKVWGAGGAGGSGKVTDSSIGSGGGSGSYIQGSVATHPGDVFSVRVGLGGSSQLNAASSGGGWSAIRLKPFISEEGVAEGTSWFSLVAQGGAGGISYLKNYYGGSIDFSFVKGLDSVPIPFQAISGAADNYADHEHGFCCLGATLYPQEDFRYFPIMMSWGGNDQVNFIPAGTGDVRYQGFGTIVARRGQVGRPPNISLNPPGPSSGGTAPNGGSGGVAGVGRTITLEMNGQFPGGGGGGASDGLGGNGADGRVEITPTVTAVDFYLSNSGDVRIIPGAGAINTITAVLTSANGGDVDLKVASIKNSTGTSFLNTVNGFTPTFVKSRVTPTEITTLNIGSMTTTPVGVYDVVVEGYGVASEDFYGLGRCDSFAAEFPTSPYSSECDTQPGAATSKNDLINRVQKSLNDYCDIKDDGVKNSSDSVRYVGYTTFQTPSGEVHLYIPATTNWQFGAYEYWTCASKLTQSNDNYGIRTWLRSDGSVSDQDIVLFKIKDNFVWNNYSFNSARTTFRITVGTPDIVPLGATGASPGPNAPVITQGINSSPGKYAVGSILSFKVQPQNIGVSFTSPDFQIKLQKKVAGASDSTYVDTGNTATVSNGLNSGMIVERTINYTSVGTDKNNVSGMEFRYCVDSTNTVNEGVAGEANNCSGSVTAVFEQTSTVGSLTCPSVANSATSIDLTWTAVGGTNVSLFRGNATTPLVTFTGTSGTYTDSNLSSNTTYTYYLRNGNVSTAQLLSTASNCKTSVSGSVGVTISGRRSGTSDPYYSFLPLSIGYGESIDISWTGVNMPSNAVCTPSGTWTNVTSLPGAQNNVGPLTQSSYTYSVTCDGVASNVLTVYVGLPSVACSGVVSGNGELVTWTAVDSPAVKTGITYLHHWGGDESMSVNGNPVTKSYLSAGIKSANVTLYATGNRNTSAVTCPSVTTKPNLIPLGAARDPISGGPNKPVVASSSLNPDGSTVISSTVVFLVQPKNVGAGFTGPTFNVKLQKKTSGTPITSYTDVPGAVATVAGGLPFASTTNRYISYVSSSGDTNTTGYDFRYCVDLPNDPNGAVPEFYEDDNCSGLTNIIFKTNTVVVPAPASVTASAPVCTAGSGKINVSWASVSGVDGYRVYRGITSTFAANAGSYLGQVTSGLTYADTGLTIKQPYYYKVLAYIGANASAESIPSPMSVPSESCPDLTAGNVRAYVNGNLVTSAQIVEDDVVSFKADITNIGGDTASSFNNRFYVDKGTVNELNLNDQILSGLSSGQLKEVSAVAPTKSWKATLGTHSVIVCADRPTNQVDEGGVNSIYESDSSNCSSGAFDNFTVLPKISATLETSRLNTNVWSKTAVIINYEDYAKLRWNITGNPSTCTLNTNPVTNILPADYSYLPNPTANNPTTIGPNLNGAKFLYMLTCTR